jgi:hypothetical protein
LISTNSEKSQELLHFLQEKTNQAESDIKGVMGNPIIIPHKGRPRTKRIKSTIEYSRKKKQQTESEAKICRK